MTDKEYGENVGKLIQDENWEIVVYCKDCRFSVEDYCAFWNTDSQVQEILPNDFCSKGKRRTECIEEEKPRKKKSEKSSYELERGL